ncbi:uncharacterized protein LOC101518591 isoform X2 [Ochotona princeps]|nr:uncharacterized protein LOC101518591 isoform X2 [Ochotona princeps]
MTLSEDEHLPSPLSDMLSLIDDKGPQTEGIFWIPGDIASYVALKNKISSGDTVDWEHESTLVAAMALQDFLRLLPGTLFSASLYGQWLRVLEEENEDKVAAVQRLLVQLPKANFVLLRCLFGTLNKIVQHSSFNPMTIPDFALSLAPRILSLWQSTFTMSEVEDELRKKITLVCFLIQNYAEIFGGDMSFVSRESSLSSYNSFEEIAQDSNNILEKNDDTLAKTMAQTLECPPIEEREIKIKEELMDNSKPTLGMDPPNFLPSMLTEDWTRQGTQKPFESGPEPSIETDGKAPVDCNVKATPDKMVKPLEPPPVPDLMSDLKHRVEADARPTSEPHLKATQKENYVRKWILQRSSWRKRDNLPQQSTQTCRPARLFGYLIQDICEQDSLPKPLFDMLRVIDQKGPLAKGMFIKHGNLKSCSELQKKLNFGYAVDWKKERTLVVGSVFLEFLLSIPGTLFMEHLYDDWLRVLDEVARKAKVAAIHRLLKLLPKPNDYLLRSMFGSLFKIAHYTASFQKACFDLSVSISPSLLWLPIADTSEQNTEWRRKASLIRFMIENYLRIFKEDMTAPKRENAENQDNCPKLSDPCLKPTERGGSGSKSLFQRGPCENQDNVPQECTSCTPPPVKLFGSLMQDICDNDNLPKSLLDLISFIEQKGLHKKGIFMFGCKSRVLKDKLNCGLQVDWEHESVTAAATTLKDFLRNIPASLFTGFLYDDWLHVLDEGNEDAKIAGIQRLLHNLPKSNRNLIHSLFGLLEKIAKHSSSNYMTASKLASCIAPSLFWLNESTILKRIKAHKRKVAVVKFLIKHFSRIFEEAVTSPMDENAINLQSSSKTSDSASI